VGVRATAVAVAVRSVRTFATASRSVPTSSASSARLSDATGPRRPGAPRRHPRSAATGGLGPAEHGAGQEQQARAGRLEAVGQVGGAEQVRRGTRRHRRLPVRPRRRRQRGNRRPGQPVSPGRRGHRRGRHPARRTARRVGHCRRSPARFGTGRGARGTGGTAHRAGQPSLSRSSTRSTALESRCEVDHALWKGLSFSPKPVPPEDSHASSTASVLPSRVVGEHAPAHTVDGDLAAVRNDPLRSGVTERDADADHSRGVVAADHFGDDSCLFGA
jgi:hypothetical protein